jgi:hypothetical protein
MEDVPCDELEPVLAGLVRHVVRDKTVEVVHGDEGEREASGAL